MKAVEKCGSPETATDMSANNAKIEAAIKSALTRYAAETAVINGAWQSAALTALFDIKLLSDGSFMKYLIKIGVSGLYGGAVRGLSSWVNHPFFSNGIVLGVIVGSAFGIVSLVSTGDWARFGKNLGVSIIGGATAWGGAFNGGAIDSAGGPIGTAIGATVGAFSGASPGAILRWRFQALAA